MLVGRNWTIAKDNHNRLFQWFLEEYPKMNIESLVGMDCFHPWIGGLRPRCCLASRPSATCCGYLNQFLIYYECVPNLWCMVIPRWRRSNYIKIGSTQIAAPDMVGHWLRWLLRGWTIKVWVQKTGILWCWSKTDQAFWQLMEWTLFEMANLSICFRTYWLDRILLKL